MKITKLNLINFRNYSNVNINFGDHMNIFIGDNAQGKTNILEAITILALTKSHRVSYNPNIIQFNKKKCFLKGVVKKEKIISKLEIEMTDEIKKFKVNKTEIRKIADYISYLNVIIFTPDDLEIIKSSPSVRRNLLNIQLSQISKNYLNTYNEYNKILKTRNEYLKILFNNNIADKNYLDILTDKLIEKAIIIYQLRKEYLDLINKRINYFYQQIASDDELEVEYLPNIEINSYDNESLRKILKHKYKKYYMKELNYGMTIYGPHRDDFIFKFKNKGTDLRLYGSQGQQKLAIISFKLAEIEIFKEKCGDYPVLLLDDIFSELDIKKRNKILKIVGDYNIQSVITTTDLKNIRKNFLENAFIFEVKAGTLERK